MPAEQDTSSNNRRIAKNTILLYIRMLFMMCISLYTSRVILSTLGVSDYGIYNVVGGFVALFNILCNSISAAISRFITVELGKKNIEKLKKVFSTSINIQLLLCLSIIIIMEVFGIWFINNKMVIDPSRLEAANWVLHLSTLTFCIELISVPYNAAIIAHEKMSAFAYISIIEAIFKLLICYLLFISPIDKLVTYAVLLTLVAMAIRLIYGIYCKKHFLECTYHYCFDKGLLKEMFSFTGWNFIGGTAGVLSSQGMDVILNLFFGTVVNAAKGVASQVTSVVTSFSSNFIMAVNPQITKNFAAGNYDYAFKLVTQGSRLSFYMLFFLSLPLILEAPTVLSVWLVEVPEYSVIFIRLVLIYAMVNSLSNPLITLMLATGNIRNYQIIVGGCLLFILPLSYIVLELGFAPQYTYVVMIVISAICLWLRLYMLHNMINFPIKRFLKDAILNISIVVVLSLLLPLLVHNVIENEIACFFATCITCVISTSLVIFYIGCNANERLLVINKTKSLIAKI